MPAISVIVPVYKVEKYIQRCVDSILGQTFNEFELVLVDDGSPDNCGTICDEYAAKDRRVIVIHQENGGLSAARNAGIDWALANSNSQWLTFIDSDDWVHSEYLRCLFDAAVTHNVAVSICGYVQTSEDKQDIDKDTLISERWKPEDFYVVHNVNATVAWGKLYRKTCFQNIRYPVGKVHEDEYTTHRILFRCSDIAVIAVPLYFYYTNPCSITQSERYPQRIQGLDALKQQADFYRVGHFKRAQAACVRNFVNCGIDLRDDIAGSSLQKREKKEYRSYIVRMLAKTICDNREVFPVTENYWIYELIFPHRMKLYWIIMAIKKKLGAR